MNNKLLGGLAAIGLLVSGVANAVPCGWFGVEPTQQCQNGTGQMDSQSLINGGSYFGASNWKFLDKVGGADRSNTEFWTVTGALRGLPSGTFSLANGLWDTYSMLAVSLQSNGAFPVGAPSSTQPVYWSLYQLIPGTYLYNWVYGATRSGFMQSVMNVTLYGVVRATSVTEPGSLALVLMGITGLAGLVIVSRRRASARR